MGWCKEQPQKACAYDIMAHDTSLLSPSPSACLCLSLSVLFLNLGYLPGPALIHCRVHHLCFSTTDSSVRLQTLSDSAALRQATEPGHCMGAALLHGAVLLHAAEIHHVAALLHQATLLHGAAFSTTVSTPTYNALSCLHFS